MMKTNIYFMVLLALLFPLEVQAESPAPVSPRPAQDQPVELIAMDGGEPVIPDREIRFERSEEVYSMKLFRADPKLFEQQYVAVVRLFSPLFRSQRYSDRGLPRDLVNLTIYQGRHLFDNRVFGILAGIRTPSSYFGELVKNIPDEHLPPREVIEFFSQEADSGYLQFEVVEDGSQFRQFVILAPTAEVAQQRAEGLVQLFDYGLTQPIQLHLRAKKHQLQQRVMETDESAEKLEAEKADIEEQLKKAEVITAEELSLLKTQQRLVAVDLAGTRARIDAAAKLLDGFPPSTSSRREQIENVKIAAEIELAGLAARQETLERMTSEAGKRLQLRQNLQMVEYQLNKLVVEKANQTEEIDHIEALIEGFQVFQLQDGKVTIQPIQWSE